MSWLQVMLSESDIRPESDWSSLQGQLSSLAAFTAVKSDEDRHQLFQEYTADLQVSISHSPFTMNSSDKGLVPGCPSLGLDKT